MKRVRYYCPIPNLVPFNVGFIKHEFYGVIPVPKVIQLLSLNSDKIQTLLIAGQTVPWLHLV